LCRENLVRLLQGSEPLLRLRRYQVALAGSNTPTVFWTKELVTTMPVCEPVRAEVVLSVAVRLWVPTVLRVMPKVCTPASAAVKV
jgi:hypothetical protein